MVLYGNIPIPSSSFYPFPAKPFLVTFASLQTAYVVNRYYIV